MHSPARHRLCTVFPLVAALALGLASAMAPGPGARAQDTLPDAHLDLDTGGHRATIRALAVSADGARLYSAGDDKVVRVWDLATGRPGESLRGQIGPGAEGTINALALSADGTRIAVAGYFAPHLSPDPPFGDVRIFDTGSGALVRVLRGHDWVVESLSYDPARDELLVAGQGGLVQRWLAPFGEAGPQPLPALDAQSNRIAAVAYTASGSRIVALTHDYGLKLWETDSGAELPVPDAEALWDVPLVALAVDAQGARFALAGEDGRVEIRDGGDGHLLAALPPQSFRAGALAFQGGLLAVSCGYRCGTTERTTFWDIATLQPVAGDDAAETGILVALPLPGGRLVATAGGRVPEIRIVAAPTGATERVLRGIGGPVSGVAISNDGTTIAWGTADPCPERPACPEVMAPLERRMQLPSGDRSIEAPRAATPEDRRLIRALLGADGRALMAGSSGGSFEADQLNILGPEPMTISKGPVDGYYFSAFGLVPEKGELIAGGGNGVLLAHGLEDGRVSGEYIGHTGDVLALAAAPAANRLLTGSADQTLRLWNLETRELIVSVFVAGEDWIIWTPQGYFQSSPEGDRLIGWHLNRGPDHEARFIRARQLRQHLHSPEIVRRAIISGDAAGAARELRGTDGELVELLSRKAPAFELRVAGEIPAPEGFATIEITGASLEEMADWGFSILVNDRRVATVRLPDPAPGADAAAPARFLYQVPLEDGANDILVTGEDDFGYVTERSGAALFKRPVEVAAPGRLFVAVVGVNSYPKLEDCGGKSCDLAFPVADAIGFLRTIKAHSAPLFASLETLVIATPDALAAAGASDVVDPASVIEPTGANITDSLIEFLSRPGPDDTTIIFVASHGVNVGEDFFLIPEDGQRRGEDWRKSSLVDWSVIQEEIGFATGRRILMLDTCHAANAFNAKLEKEAADARVIVFSATAANNTAQERRDLGHGIFTWSLIEGLSGAAGQEDGVRLLGLADYIYREVVALSGGKQEPFYHISQTANFLLAKK